MPSQFKFDAIDGERPSVYSGRFTGEVYLNAVFAGHEAAITFRSNSLAVEIRKRIDGQWTPLTTFYQLERVDPAGAAHPFEVTDQRFDKQSYRVFFRNLRKRGQLIDQKFEFYTICGTLGTLSGMYLFHVELGWRIYETIGQAVINPAALARVRFT